MAHRRRRPKQSGGVGLSVLFVGLLLAIVVVHYWQVFLVVAGVVVGVMIWRWQNRRARRAAARARQAELDRHVATTDGMTGTEFEALIERLLVRDGYRDVRRNGGSGDLGADVTALDGNGHRLVIQCKRYGKQAVSSPDVQRFLGTVFNEHNAQVPMFVTTSRFTAPAKALADRHGIVLVDRQRLAEWMAKADVAPTSAIRDAG